MKKWLVLTLLISLLVIPGCSSTKTLKAQILRVRVQEIQDIRGLVYRFVYLDWKNTAEVRILKVVVDLTAHDILCRIVSIEKTLVLYAVKASAPGVKLGEAHIADGDEGTENSPDERLPPGIKNSTAVKVEATIASLEENLNS